TTGRSPDAAGHPTTAAGPPGGGPATIRTVRGGRSALVLLAEEGLEPLGRVLAGLVERAPLGGVVQRLELLGEVRAQPAAVLALEGAQRLDLAAELVALLLQVAEELGAALGRLRVEHLGAGAGVGLEALGLRLALGLQPLGRRAGRSEDR